jgi:hypothetical protein
MRQVGLAMKHPKGRKAPKPSSKEPRHIRLFHAHISLPVFRTMDPLAKSLLIEVLARYNGVNNGEISYSCREAEEDGVMCRNSAQKAFDILQNRGWLRLGRDSSFHLKILPNGHGINRSGTRAREWWITFLPGPNGEKPTMDFLEWVADRVDPSKTKAGPPVWDATSQDMGRKDAEGELNGR